MLVLTRRVNESIVIGDQIEVTVVSLKGSGDQAVVRLGVKAPRSVSVYREEIYREIQAENQRASGATAAGVRELLQMWPKNGEKGPADESEPER